MKYFRILGRNAITEFKIHPRIKTPVALCAQAYSELFPLQVAYFLETGIKSNPPVTLGPPSLSVKKHEFLFKRLGHKLSEGLLSA